MRGLEILGVAKKEGGGMGGGGRATVVWRILGGFGRL